MRRAATVRPSARCWLDADENGWPDLYVINEFGSGVLLVNHGDGTFREQRLADEGPGDFGSMGITCRRLRQRWPHRSLRRQHVLEGRQPESSAISGPGLTLSRSWPGSTRSLTGSQLHHNLGGLKFEQIGRRTPGGRCGLGVRPRHGRP